MSLVALSYIPMVLFFFLGWRIAYVNYYRARQRYMRQKEASMNYGDAVYEQPYQQEVK